LAHFLFNAKHIVCLTQKSLFVLTLNTLFALYQSEPNLLTHTAHSISRKGIKKKDLNDTEVREILADLLPYVRTSHIIPAHSDVLTSAIKRGLVSVPPLHLLGGGGAAESSSASSWVRTRNISLFVKPRLFISYYDELKVRSRLCALFYCLLIMTHFSTKVIMFTLF